MEINKEMCNIPDNILALLQKDVAEIKVALLGNEYNPQGGLLYRTAVLEKLVETIEEKHDREIQILKDKYNRILWTTGTATAIITAVVSFISQFWDKLALLPK